MKIDNYKFGLISIDGISYNNDLIILPDRVVPNWWRETGHVFSFNDCRIILDANPDFIVFGLGAYGIAKLARDLLEELESCGIEYSASNSKKACKLFNEKAGMNVAGAFHLTC